MRFNKGPLQGKLGSRLKSIETPNKKERRYIRIDCLTILPLLATSTTERLRIEQGFFWEQRIVIHCDRS